MTIHRAALGAALATIAGVFVWSMLPNSTQPPHAFLERYGKPIGLVAKVVREPMLKQTHIQLTVAPQGLERNILVFADRFSSFAFGDIVHITGELQEAPVFEDFNYREYLKVKGIYATMYFPKVELAASSDERSVAAVVFLAREKLRQVLSQNIPNPESALLGALLLGDQGALSEPLKAKLNATGLRHIIAISGQHVVILTNMLMALFLALGLWRRQALALAFFFMVLFVLLSGMEASAIRAGIMGGVLLVGQYLGRLSSSWKALVFAAALMLLENPLLLTRDVGFQLSFLAVGGIIFSYSFFQHVLRRVPKTLGLREMLAMNFAAQLFTLPLLMYNFGFVSAISPLTNILVLPMIPFLIGIGLVFLLAGAVWSFLGAFLSLPVFLFASYFTFVAEFFSKIPFAYLATENLSPLWLILLYVVILFFIRKFNHDMIPRI